MATRCGALPSRPPSPRKSRGRNPSCRPLRRAPCATLPSNGVRRSPAPPGDRSPPESGAPWPPAASPLALRISVRAGFHANPLDAAHLVDDALENALHGLLRERTGVVTPDVLENLIF